MRLLSATGNLGIGTMSPSEKLHIAGKVKIEDFANVNSKNSLLVTESGTGVVDTLLTQRNKILGTDASGLLEWKTASSFNTDAQGFDSASIDDSSGEIYLSLDNSTNDASINVSSYVNTEISSALSGLTLSVNGDVQSTSTALSPSGSLTLNINPDAIGSNEIINNSITTTDILNNTITNDDLSNIPTGVGGIYKGNGTLPSDVNVTQNSFDLNFDANTLFIDGSANRVGVGTNAPTYKLHAIANTDTDGFLFQGHNNTTGEKDIFTITDPDDSGSGQDNSSLLKVQKTGLIDGAALGYNLIELVNESSTTGNSKEMHWITGRNSDNGAPKWGVDLKTHFFWSTGGILLGASSLATGVYTGGNFIVLPDGKVGIGTTTPAAKLHVNGNVKLENGFANTATQSNSDILVVNQSTGIVDRIAFDALKSCPAAMTAVDDHFCVDNTKSTNVTDFWTANKNCRDNNKRLCDASELGYVIQDNTPGVAALSSHEWTSSIGANSALTLKEIGTNGIESAARNFTEIPYNYRCCYSR